MKPSKKRKQQSSNRVKDIAKGTAAAAAVLYAGGDAAQADIVHVTTPISVTGDGATAPWNLDGAGIAEFDLTASANSGYYGPNINLRLQGIGGSGAPSLVQIAGDNQNELRNVPIGLTIAAGLSGSYAFASNNNHFVTYAGNFLQALGFADGVDGYVGFKFDPGAGDIFGWARITVDAANDASHVLTIQEWAYEDSGASIDVGQTSSIPEPSSVALLGLLAAGIGGVRRSRRKDAAKSSS